METLFPGLKTMLNLHPLFVHYPIAFWVGALIFELLAVARSSEEFHRTAARLLYAGTLFALAAVATGLLAESSVPESGPAHEVMELHERLMLGATSLAVGLSFVAFFLRQEFTPARRRLLLLGLVVLAGLMSIGADRGALMVYGHGVAVNWPSTQQQK